MKKKIIWLSACVFLMLCMGGSILFSFRDSPKCGFLKMNGFYITQENVIIHSNYAELPLTEVMKNLNMKVDWCDKSTAEIAWKNKKYTLNLSKVSLIEVGQDSNLLLPPPGGNRFYTVLEKELILDSNTIKSALYQMGIRVDIDINVDERIVHIYERTGNSSLNST